MDSPVALIRENIQRYGLESYGRYYGVYRAIVEDVADPQKRGRVRARCPAAGHGSAPDAWLDPAMAGAGSQHGVFYPPQVGDTVWITFENGEPQSPCMYFGGWYGIDDMPHEMRYGDDIPQRRGLVTRAGHHVVFVDEPGKESIHIVWHKPDSGDAASTDVTKTADRTTGDFSFVTFNDTGGIQLHNMNGTNINLDAKNGALVLMDEHGNTVTLDSDGIKLIDREGNSVSIAGGEISLIGSSKVHVVSPTVNVKGGTVVLGDTAQFSAVVGEILQAWLDTHTHPSSTGPTGPPIIPSPPAILSQGVKLRP